MSTSLLALRASSEAGTAEQKRLAEKKKNLVILVHSYLIENGFIESAERLQYESGSVTTKLAIADNIDLMIILGEYETYYEMRFEKKPKLTRILKDGEEAPRARKPSKPDSGGQKKRESKPDSGSNKLPTVNGAVPGPEATDDSLGMGIQGTSVGADKSRKLELENAERLEDRMLKPPPQFGGDADMKQLAQSISREIYQESPDVRFEDIVGLDEAKRLLKEAVQLPLRFPKLFTGILRPWKGILLHGPPGTGKTLLAKAVATECKTTFFNISASSLVSKWRGDSEKLVRALFELARYHAPSTIFLDEIDSILTSRNGEGGEHEASRRMKTELLIQMDGVRGVKPNEQVFVMAASNLPWDLDIAVLRRLEKRVLVSLPTAAARESMLVKHLSSRGSPDLNFSAVAAMTEGYSGADLELVCREAAMMPVRRLMAQLQLLEASPPPAPQSTNSKVTSIASMAPSAGIAAANRHNRTVQGAAVDVDALLSGDPVTSEDISAALNTTKPSSDRSIAKYEAWQNEFGSV